MTPNRRAAGIAVALFAIVASLACAGGSDQDPEPSATHTAATTPPTTNSPAPPETSEPPPRDLLDLARRFRGYPYDGPTVARTEPYDHEIGDREEFTLVDLAETSDYTISATVEAITDHAYFFVQDGAAFDPADLDAVAAAFEDSVWPEITASFGMPPTPGVDADTRITILHADLKGAGGYVSGSDQYPEGAVPRSAERDIIYVDTTLLTIAGSEYNALVAHELQHLVHIANDVNEESWVNEGLSEVAWEMAGGGSDGVLEFLDSPDTQLNFWPYFDDVGVHYSASELFFGYVLDQYGGRENAGALAEIQANGILGVDQYLESFGRAFHEVFADFAAANVLDLSEGPFSHPGFDGTTSAIEAVAAGESDDANVRQYGTDYYRIDSNGTFDFAGEEDVTIGIPARDGPFWWSSRSDGIDSRLTRAVDLTDAKSATLTFDLWHDIEPGWDYGYVAVSTDEGRTWTAVPGEHTTLDDPVGASYGPAYTGDTEGWASETVDLGDYAGEEILLRFEYVTDDATHLTGMAVDNIAIKEIGLVDSADSEQGWILEGFRRVEGPLKQEFIVQIIHPDGQVDRVELREGNRASLDVRRDDIVAISGATDTTTELAPYRWSLEN